MQRVSTDMMNNDMQFWLRRTEANLSAQEGRVATQNRLMNLRDDPLGAARAVRYDSALVRLQRYEKNAAYASDNYKISETYARQALDVVQRLREIAVQGANGVYAARGPAVHGPGSQRAHERAHEPRQRARCRRFLPLRGRQALHRALPRGDGHGARSRPGRHDSCPVPR